MNRRVVVVGAGPIGLAAALGAVRRGHDVTVLERDQVGGALLRWGGVRLFSPVSMNLTPEIAEVLGGSCPAADALLTGTEHVAQVLRPVAAHLGERVRVGHRVVAIGRAGMRRGDYPNHPIRAERPFRLVVEADGRGSWLEADAVLDATGVYGTPQWLGSGGLPAPGEPAAPVIRDLGGLRDALPRLADRRVVLVGHGHSAAHAVRWLGDAGASVVWATRSGNTRPCVDVANDPLPERARVVGDANGLAARPPPWLRVERRATVEAIAPREVRLSGGRVVTEVDAIVGLVGYRPDLGPVSELALEVAPTTEGTARLALALAGVTDCLTVPRVSPDDLETGEPGYVRVGANSYGRATTFLLRTGFAQLAQVLDRLGAPRS
ncbi:MAG: FAD-dependent oxidoreductase [Myxococcota bacterium]